MSTGNFNPALGFINAGVQPKNNEQEKPAPVSPRANIPEYVTSRPEYIAETPAEEKRDRRFQALFRPSVFGALEIYCKVHKMSINEALEQFVTTEKHVEGR